MPIALLALTLSAFAIGTTEFVIVGLLPTVAADLSISIPSAGLLVSLYALGVAIGAPVLTALTGKLPRKALLLALMALFTAGNLLAWGNSTPQVRCPRLSHLGRLLHNIGRRKHSQEQQKHCNCGTYDEKERPAPIPAEFSPVRGLLAVPPCFLECLAKDLTQSRASLRFSFILRRLLRHSVLYQCIGQPLIFPCHVGPPTKC